MDNELILEDRLGDKIFKMWVHRRSGRVYFMNIQVARVMNNDVGHGEFSNAIEVDVSLSGKYKMKGRGSWNYTPEQLTFLLSCMQDMVDKI